MLAMGGELGDLRMLWAQAVRAFRAYRCAVPTRPTKHVEARRGLLGVSDPPAGILAVAWPSPGHLLAPRGNLPGDRHWVIVGERRSHAACACHRGVPGHRTGPRGRTGRPRAGGGG